MNEKILLAHGSGGRLMRELITDLIFKNLQGCILGSLDDSAVFEMQGRVAYTTDSFVVTPLFFKGGDIGKLSVCGTVNDLSMVGARPLYLTASFIIEEGFLLKDLERIVVSMRESACSAGIKIAAGDIKVVNSGDCDKLFINTSGLGLVRKGVDISAVNARAGDKVIISGSIGDHAIAILSERENLDFQTELESDCCALNSLVDDMLRVSAGVHTLRDLTRGGLATALNEIAASAGVGIRIFEEKIPIKEEVKAACEMLGFEPLYLANEGRLVAIVQPADATRVLTAMRKNRYAKQAGIIGEVIEKPEAIVSLSTVVGGSRIVDMLVADQLPRIC